jgi:hypothetical protein
MKGGGGVVIRQVWDRKEMHAGFYWRNIKEQDRFVNLGVDGRIKLKWVLKNEV